MKKKLIPIVIITFLGLTYCFRFLFGFLTGTPLAEVGESMTKGFPAFLITALPIAGPVFLIAGSILWHWFINKGQREYKNNN